jgi:hypothetical protein
MNNRPSNSDSDNHRVVDLFSPSEDSVDPRETGQRSVQDRPVSTDMPASFVFTNPLFARPSPERRGECV